MSERKVIQIIAVYDSADDVVYQFALCDDGTLWERANFGKWEKQGHAVPGADSVAPSQGGNDA